MKAKPHPAQDNLMATLSFNLTELKDLDYICESATRQFNVGGEPAWMKRAIHYRQIFASRIAELEEQLKLSQLSQATGPEEIREALKGWTPEELGDAGIV